MLNERSRNRVMIWPGGPCGRMSARERGPFRLRHGQSPLIQVRNQLRRASRHRISPFVIQRRKSPRRTVIPHGAALQAVTVRLVAGCWRTDCRPSIQRAGRWCRACGDRASELRNCPVYFRLARESGHSTRCPAPNSGVQEIRFRRPTADKSRCKYAEARGLKTPGPQGGTDRLRP